MTHTERGPVRELAPRTNGRAVPCFVQHDNAGGWCERPAVVRVYGIRFCAEHGEEAKIGALLEAHQDARRFFERFRNPQAPSDPNYLVDREIEAAAGRIAEEGPSDRDHYRALRRAYANPPEDLRGSIRQWERDEGERRETVVDDLLDSLETVCKLMRLADDAGETWLVEMLELHRESIAAQAAYALREAPALCEARPGE